MKLDNRKKLKFGNFVNYGSYIIDNNYLSMGIYYTHSYA